MNKREYAKLKKWTDTLTDEELKTSRTRNALTWSHIVVQRLFMRRVIGKWKKENE